MTLVFYAQTWVDVTTQYIQNPSFEEYTACPQGTSMQSQMWVDSCLGWFAPTYGTSDYFNSCNNTIATVGVPNNYPMTFQYSFQGEAYCGFLAYSLDANANSLWSEYLQTKLKKKLKINTQYRFSMRINRANFYNFSVQDIGAHFSQNSMSNTTTEPYNLTPTVLNQTGFINDTSNWTLVSGKFVAAGNENYLTIGWFGDTITDDYSFFIPPDIDSTTGDSLYLTEIYYAVDSLTLSELVYNFDNFNVNIITPNGDNVNDDIDFAPYQLKSLDFTVLNRWGNVVYQTSDINTKWSGTNNENKLSDGVYFYLIHAEMPDGKIINKHNYITIFY